MAKAIPQEDVKEYGQQVVEEQNAEALATGAEGAQADNPIVDPNAAAPATAPQPAPQQAAPAAAPARTGFKPTNLMQRVPHRYAPPQPSNADVQANAGLLWEVLAQDPQATDSIRAFARRMQRR